MTKFMRVFFGGLTAFVVLAGCSSPYKSPARSSISGLTFETRSTSGALFRHNEVTSIQGLFPVPDLGLFIHYSNPSDPTSAIGISRGHSFKLVGTVGGDAKAGPLATFDDVVNMRELLMKTQSIASEAIVSATALRVAEAQRKALESSKQKVEGLERAALAKVEAANKALADKDAKLKEIQEKLIAQKETIDNRLNQNDLEIAKVSKKNGLIVARWNASTASQAGIKAARYATAGASSKDSIGGFLILAEPRVQMLYAGDDFFQFLKWLNTMTHPDANCGQSGEAEPLRLNAQEILLFSKESFPTYQLQARHVAYVAERDLSESLRIDAAFKIQDIYGIGIQDIITDEVAINYYRERVAALGNAGVISGVKWEKKPYCFFGGADLDRYEGSDSTVSNDVSGWSTVLTQNTSLSGLTTSFLKYATESDYPYGSNVTGRHRCNKGRCAVYPALRLPTAQDCSQPHDAK